VLNINPKTAEGDACKLEHSISPETFDRLTKLIEFVDTCPENETPEWLKNYK
jgi:DtxR family Mn-dependent transcriptional regulator